jgi:hypothetical protein
VVENVSVTVEGCTGDGSTATVTLIAETNPSSATGTYQWDFDDGTSTTTTAPTLTQNYASSGPKTATVTLFPDQAGCSDSSASLSFDVPACGGGGDGGGSDGGEGFGCGGLRWTIVILTALAAIAFFICTCVPGASPAFCYVAAGFAAAAAVAGLLWGIFCKKPCGWGYLLAWQVGLVVGIGALYFAQCCPWLIAIAIAGIGEAVATFALWIRRCKPSWCKILAELAVVLAGFIVPTLGWIAGIPLLSACVNPIVASTVSTVSGIVAILLASCAAFARR